MTSSRISSRHCDDPADGRLEGVSADRIAPSTTFRCTSPRENSSFLTGPSGSGKSTMLKLIFMEERPTAGEVRVSGVNSASLKRGDVAQLRRKLGVVFQDFPTARRSDRACECRVRARGDGRGAGVRSRPRSAAC